ncbi:MAG TPA: oligosaccharide flippase family protein [Bacillota bacterium]|nr:oligosaccharide flippase family protein [Bacillota bacterium]
MRRSRLITDVGQLAAAAATARILGLAYRVLLARAIGAEALGLFQLALPIYLVVLTVSSLGLSVAVTQRVAAAAANNDLGRAARIRRQAATLGGCTAAAGTALLLTLAPGVGRSLLRDPRAAAPLAVLAWAIPFAVVEGIYRGYWQGLHRMVRVGLAQVGENGVRLLALIVWLLLAPAMPAATAAAGAAGLVILGECVELLAVTARAHRDPAVTAPGPEGADMRQMLGMSLPVAMSRMAGTLGMALDAALIPSQLLAGGMDALTATAAFGRFMGMVMPVVTFPTVLMGPIATAMVPSVAEASARKWKVGLRKRAAVAAVAAAVLGVGTALVLSSASGWLGLAIYGQAHLGPLLAEGGLIAPGLFLSMAAGSVLHGLGRTGASLGCQMAGGVCRLGLILAWVAPMGIAGAVLATAVGFAVTAAGEWGFVAVLLSRP